MESRNVMGWQISFQRGAFLVISAALLVRSAALMVLAPGLQKDVDGYRHLAVTLRTTGVFGWQSNRETRPHPTAFRPPLYPLVLAATVHGGQLPPWPVAILHLALGLATVGLSIAVGRWWGLGRWSWLTGLLVACDPILINQSTQVMTETLATVLAIAGLAALSWYRVRGTKAAAALAGIVLALSALCRPTFLPWLGLLCAVWILLGRNQRHWNFRHGLIMAVAAAAVLSPWALRNARVFGTPKVTTTHGGYTLLLGNNPSFYNHLRHAPWFQTWDGRDLAEAWQRRFAAPRADDPRWSELELRNLSLQHLPGPPPGWSELDDDRLAYDLARRFIREQPGWFAYACLVRIARLWSPVPHVSADRPPTRDRLIRWFSGLWYAAVYVLALTGMIRLGGRLWQFPWLPGTLLCVTVTAVHAFYWSDMRMRSPLVPVIALLATVGVQWWVGRMGRHQNRIAVAPQKNQ